MLIRHDAPTIGRPHNPKVAGSNPAPLLNSRRPRSATWAFVVAWLLIKYRMDQGLSQEKLAELVGTSHSQISRIESGRHRTNLDTLSRIAHALGLRMVLGFESTTSSGRAKRDLVAF